MTRRLPQLLVRGVLLLSFGVALTVVTLGGAGSAASVNYAYDTSAHVYDVAAQSVQVHTAEAAPFASQEVATGVQGAVANAAGPLSFVLLKSAAADRGLVNAVGANPFFRPPFLG